MEALFKALREHGWQEDGTTICAPGKTMWLETGANWPASVEAFLADMESRKKRVLAMRESVTPDEFDTALADVESALKAAEGLS
jgi:hypothetical protein